MPALWGKTTNPVEDIFLQVPSNVVAKLAQIGVTDPDIFSKMADTAVDLRTFLKDDFTLVANSTKKKVLTARILNVWESATTRGQKRKAEEAEQRIGDMPRTIPRTTFLGLSQSAEDLYGEWEDENTPHKSYFESKLDEIEDGEFKAELMRKILAKSDAMDAKGGKLNYSAGLVPATSEELRHKVKVIAHVWELVRIKLPSLPLLSDYRAHIWEKYVTWLLGKQVFGTVVKDTQGREVFKPPWTLLLSFELEVRKAMVKILNHEAVTLSEALTRAMADRDVLQLHFKDPMSLSAGTVAAQAAVQAQASSSSRRASPSFPTHGAAWAASEPLRLPPPPAAPNPVEKDISQEVCFKYQRGTCPGNCGRLHMCLVCGDEHPSKSKECKWGQGAGKRQGQGKYEGPQVANGSGFGCLDHRRACCDACAPPVKGIILVCWGGAKG